MGAWEHRSLAGELAQLKERTTVTALLLIEDADAESLLLKIVECLGDLELGGSRELLENLGTDFLTESADSLAAGNLARGVEGSLDAVTCDLIGDLQHSLVNIEEGELALRLSGLGDELVLGGDERTGLLPGKIKGLLEFLFRKFIGGTLDHDDLLAVSDINEIEIA